MKKLLLVLLVFTTSISWGAMVTGTYTGDGNATQAITGLGGQPDVLLVKAETSADAWVATSTMTSGEAKNLSGSEYGPVTGIISSLDSDGFTVALSEGISNESGVVYYYVAWDDNDGDVTVGSFNPSTAGAISEVVGYRPGMVWVFGGTTTWSEKSPAQYIMDGVVNTSVFQFSDGGVISAANYKILSSIDATGFTTTAATSSATHSGPGIGVDYHYVTFKQSDNCELGSYSGNNGTAQDISLSLAPKFIMVKETSSSNNNWFKTVDMEATESFKFTNTASTISITGLSSSPTEFSVGTNGEVNGGSTYDYFAFTSQTTLPVELISFTGKEIGEGNLLEWITASEINTQEFIIEKSTNGLDFKEIGSVVAVGNSFEQNKYFFIDVKKTSINYYRLKMVDFDGSFEYSNVLVISNGGYSSELGFELYNMDGQIIYKSYETYNPYFRYPVSSGIYIVRIGNIYRKIKY